MFKRLAALLILLGLVLGGGLSRAQDANDAPACEPDFDLLHELLTEAEAALTDEDDRDLAYGKLESAADALTLALETCSDLRLELMVRAGSATVNLRSGPGTQFEVVGTILNGTPLLATKSENGWYRFRYEGRSVWILGDLTGPRGALTSGGGSSGSDGGGSAPQPTAPSQAVCACHADTYNCGDFSTQAQAQACFNYCVSLGRGDIHRLDGDGNGRACESLR